MQVSFGRVRVMPVVQNTITPDTSYEFVGLIAYVRVARPRSTRFLCRVESVLVAIRGKFCHTGVVRVEVAALRRISLP